MTFVTIIVDPERLKRAIDEEVSHHWRRLDGTCECGRSRSKDPVVIREHIADEVLAVVLRFQNPPPEPNAAMCGMRAPHKAHRVIEITIGGEMEHRCDGQPTRWSRTPSTASSTPVDNTSKPSEQ